MNKLRQQLNELEKVCDDFAIAFVKYIDKSYYQHPTKRNCYAKCEEDFHSGETYTIKELLKLYKNE